MAIFTKNKGLKGGHHHRRCWGFDIKHKRWVRVRKLKAFPVFNGDIVIDPNSMADRKYAKFIELINNKRAEFQEEV